MGVVIPFEPHSAGRSVLPSATTTDNGMFDAERRVLAALRDGRDCSAILDAARPLIALCRDRFGFTVMRRGLPQMPSALATALLTLSRSLRRLDLNFGGRRPLWTYGVYFGQSELAWFEDGYGSFSGLAVPDGMDADELSRFILDRITRH